MRTPFGFPVVPDVYMRTAACVGSCRRGADGYFLPVVSTSDSFATLMPQPSTLLAADESAASSVNVTTSLSVFLSLSAMLARTLRSFASANTTLHLLCAMANRAPSSPRVA